MYTQDCVRPPVLDEQRPKAHCEFSTAASPNPSGSGSCGYILRPERSVDSPYQSDPQSVEPESQESLPESQE